jgi:subtilase family serine protease
MSRNRLTQFLRPSLLLTCAAAICGFSPTLYGQPARSAPARVLITQPIDASQLVTLVGNTRAEATAQNDRGILPDDFALDHMLLELKRSPEREQAVKNFIDEQHDSKSPNFHKWLTAVQLGQLFGPAQQDIDTLTEWLRSSGFTVNTVQPSGMTIDFSGTAGQVRTAFHTEIHSLSVNGQAHLANMSDPQIPVALAPVITGIASLHNFRPRSMLMPSKKLTGTEGGMPVQLVTPSDLATIYNFNPAFSANITGKGQTIAVLEDSDLFLTSDWTTFRNTFGLSSYTSGSLVTVHPGGCPDPGATSADAEASVDAEWASAAAPNATIMLASCADTQTTIGVLIALQNLINSGSLPQAISISYGFCEAGNGAAMNASFNAAYQQAVSEGVSVFVSSGDEGAASCDADQDAATHGIGVSGFASTPYNVAVGGTDFGDTYQNINSTYWSPTNSATYGSALSYIPEIPWNASCASSIAATYFKYAVAYGPSGFCGSILSEEDAFEVVGGGSGGPSGCATGAATQSLVVSGSCQGYAKPPWQAGVPGIPNDQVRDIPDVSLFASNEVWGHAYIICFSDPTNGGAPCTGNPVNWVNLGGTSFASPIMAGIQALVNQQLGGGPQGNPNPVYYKLAASSAASLVFHPITAGDITVNCAGDINCFGQGFVGRGRMAFPTGYVTGNGGLSTSSSTFAPAYAAGNGYSLATGLGSVNAYNLIMNWTKGQ